MPQFEMPFAGREDQFGFSCLDSLAQGFIEAMFFTECHADNPELVDATFADLAPEALTRIRLECAEFATTNAADLETAWIATDGAYGETEAGRDYWYTRNGHGCGFWDRNLGEIGDRLSIAAGRITVDLYRGDDGRLYLS